MKNRKKVGGKINWKNISLREIQSLSERMFDAANVPVSARKNIIMNLIVIFIIKIDRR